MRSRLSQLEATKAELDLALRKNERQHQEDSNRHDHLIKNMEEKQRQGKIFHSKT